MDFQLAKQNALTKSDKSHEQKWDKKIKPLCEKINNLENYFTTSSCSGRITIVKATNKKIKDAFLFKSHKKITVDEIKKFFEENYKEQIYFRMEPAALHVACKTIEDATKLLNESRNIGFKKSGIISEKVNKITVEMFGSESLALPISKEIPEKYLEILAEESNNKLERTWDKIKKLEKFIPSLKK